MQPTRDPVVTVENVTVRYGNKVVLTGLGLDVGDGEFLSVIGRSGCGKTTLLRMVAGLSRPTSGTVRIGGVSVTSPGQDSAMVFQADSLFPWQNVNDNATFGLRATGVPRKEARRRADEWLDRVGLTGIAQMKPRQLSGGMRQRVNLVRALVTRPRVLLMDEPFAALDYQTREELQAELVRLCRESGTTVLFVTHDVTEATYLGDRIIVLDADVQGIKRTIDIPWGRDRPLQMKHTAEFAETSGLVWRALTHSDDYAPRTGEVAE